jgi:hypothetical protein
MACAALLVAAGVSLLGAGLALWLLASAKAALQADLVRAPA